MPEPYHNSGAAHKSCFMSATDPMLFNFFKKAVEIQTYINDGDLASSYIVPYERVSVEFKVHLDSEGIPEERFVILSAKMLDGDVKSWVIVSTDMSRPCNAIPYSIEGFISGIDTDPSGFMYQYGLAFYNEDLPKP